MTHRFTPDLSASEVSGYPDPQKPLGADKLPLIAVVKRNRTTRAGITWGVECDGHLIADRIWPFRDMAKLLLASGYPPETPITMRHFGAANDSFVPMPIYAAAKGRARGDQPEALTMGRQK